MKIDLSEIKIRRVEEQDIETMVLYRLDYLAELQGERDENYKLKVKKELTEYFIKMISEGSYKAVVAQSGIHPLSYGGLIVKRIPGDFNKTSYLEGEIMNMYTIPEARRKGISSLILKALLQIAKESGMSKVALHTSKDGEKLYRKFGFSEPAYPFLEVLID
ncbi:MAG: GNAT family N-acetyltransferase [Bacteroidota bacterium]